MPYIHQTTIFRTPAKTIFLATLIAGTLDISAAVIHYMIRSGKRPEGVFRFVASGVFGRAAFTGEPAMLVWGGVFHYLIAFLFSLLFFLLYPFVPAAKKYPVATGLLYGLMIWLIMNLVVVPLSNTPDIPFNLKQALIGMLILMGCIGLPISLIVNKYYLYKKTS